MLCFLRQLGTSHPEAENAVSLRGVHNKDLCLVSVRCLMHNPGVDCTRDVIRCLYKQLWNRIAFKNRRCQPTGLAGFSKSPRPKRCGRLQARVWPPLGRRKGNANQLGWPDVLEHSNLCAARNGSKKKKRKEKSINLQSRDVPCNVDMSHRVLVILVALACAAVLCTADDPDANRRLRLRKAVQDGDVKRVKELWEGEADAKAKDENDATLLHMAAKNGRNGVVILLLKMGVDINAEDKYRRTPLHRATLFGHVEVVGALLDGGANADVVDVNGVTPLQLAAYKGHAEVARMLLEKKADVNAEDVDGVTPLHLAAEEGYTDVVRALLDGNAKVDAKNEDA